MPTEEGRTLEIDGRGETGEPSGYVEAMKVWKLHMYAIMCMYMQKRECVSPICSCMCLCACTYICATECSKLQNQRERASIHVSTRRWPVRRLVAYAFKGLAWLSASAKKSFSV